MTAPGADPSGCDPSGCFNSRVTDDIITCGRPEDQHCKRCQACPGACDCATTATLDDTMLALALDAFARNGSHPSWQALDRVISRSCAESYRSDIGAAIAPLLAEIHRLTTEVDNLKHSKETS